MTCSWVSKGLSDFSREFYEFTMPAVDMFEGDDTNELIVKIDLPGYAKKDIREVLMKIFYVLGQIGSGMKSCIRDLFIINIDLDR
jgi:hypothetical protein